MFSPCGTLLASSSKNCLYQFCILQAARMKSALTLVLILGVSLLEASKFRCDYAYFENAHGWLKLHRTKDTWSEASHSCQLEGAELASPSTDGVKYAMLALAISGDVNMVHTARPSTTNSELVLALTLRGTDKDVTPNDHYPFICYKQADEDIQLNECGTVDNEYKLDNRTGHCYKFHKTPSNWQESGRICDAEGARLAVINSKEEAEIMRDIWLQNPPNTIPVRINWYRNFAFIGAVRQGSDWKTIDGQTIQEAGYDVFNAGEPNNYHGDQFCLTVARNGQLFDDPCWQIMSFICERVPENSCDSNFIPHSSKPTRREGIVDRSSKHFLNDTDLKTPF